MTIDHAALVAEAQRRLDQARALDGEEWDTSLPTLSMLGVSTGVVRQHIVAWDPAAAVAVCEGWLDTLGRHRPHPGDPRGCLPCYPETCPCLEVRTVARQMRMERGAAQ